VQHKDPNKSLWKKMRCGEKIKNKSEDKEDKRSAYLTNDQQEPRNGPMPGKCSTVEVPKKENHEQWGKAYVITQDEWQEGCTCHEADGKRHQVHTVRADETIEKDENEEEDEDHSGSYPRDEQGDKLIESCPYQMKITKKKKSKSKIKKYKNKIRHIKGNINKIKQGNKSHTKGNIWYRFFICERVVVAFEVFILKLQCDCMQVLLKEYLVTIEKICIEIKSLLNLKKNKSV